MSDLREVFPELDFNKQEDITTALSLLDFCNELQKIVVGYCFCVKCEKKRKKLNGEP